eukprot:Nk52_evm23s240 gene=Nk52_evmTU23s240
MAHNKKVNSRFAACNSNSMGSPLSCIANKSSPSLQRTQSCQGTSRQLSYDDMFRPQLRSKTPKRCSEDRFIPNRKNMDINIQNYNLTHELPLGAIAEGTSPAKANYRASVAETLFPNLAKHQKVLAFADKAPAPADGHQNDIRVLYSNNQGARAAKSQAGLGKKQTRHIPQTSDRILDAPDLLDDFYLNLLDWSATNLLAVALGNSVYLWNSKDGSIHHLLENEAEDNSVTSLSWIKDGSYLAVGNNDCEVQLWDVEKAKQVRSLKGHDSRVGALAWNDHILSSGSRDGSILNSDVRARTHAVQWLEGHTQEVCGLKWSPDGTQLASGGNDNLVNVWDANKAKARYTFDDHIAAVKALDWCPWHPHLLATGGGTADRHIKFWNTQSGSLLNSIDTKSQVCSLKWSKNFKELVSSHGFSQNQLTIWKYPTMKKVTELCGHTSRVLHMAMSPDGETVVSAAGDETLRFWKCFQADPKLEAAKKKKVKDMQRMKPSALMATIRKNLQLEERLGSAAASKKYTFGANAAFEDEEERGSTILITLLVGILCVFQLRFGYSSIADENKSAAVVYCAFLFASSLIALSALLVCHRPTLLGVNMWKLNHNLPLLCGVLSAVSIFWNAVLLKQLYSDFGWKVFEEVGPNTCLQGQYFKLQSLSVALATVWYFIISIATMKTIPYLLDSPYRLAESSITTLFCGITHVIAFTLVDTISMKSLKNPQPLLNWISCMVLVFCVISGIGGAVFGITENVLFEKRSMLMEEGRSSVWLFYDVKFLFVAFVLGELISLLVVAVKLCKNLYNVNQIVSKYQLEQEFNDSFDPLLSSPSLLEHYGIVPDFDRIRVDGEGRVSNASRLTGSDFFHSPMISVGATGRGSLYSCNHDQRADCWECGCNDASHVADEPVTSLSPAFFNRGRASSYLSDVGAPSRVSGDL